jgi:hypothetical protein
MILEVAGASDCMKAQDTPLFHGTRFIRIDIFKSEALRPTGRSDWDWSPDPVLDTRWKRWCVAAGSRCRLRWHMLVSLLQTFFLLEAEIKPIESLKTKTIDP